MKFCSWLPALLVIGYAILGGYLAFDFVRDVRRDFVVPNFQAVTYLAESNIYLNQQIEAARNAVRQLNTENSLLKNSVRTGAVMLQDQIEENTDLYAEIEMLEWKILFLENTIKPNLPGFDDNPPTIPFFEP